MSRISTICTLSGILAALTFSVNMASAGSVAVHTTTPNVNVRVPHTNIGSQSSGAGAGKVTFNPFQITKKTDKASPSFYDQSAGGKHYPAGPAPK